MQATMTPVGTHTRRPVGGRVTVAALTSLALWALAGAQTAYWGWRAWGVAPAEPLPSPTVSAAVVDTARVARALGAQVVPSADGDAPLAQAAPASHPAQGWRLVGVIADRAGAGAALLAREGSAPRAYRVGATLPDGWRVDRVERTGVWLAPVQGGEAVRLSLPAATTP
ncbi:hypothetical protein [Tepidimonas charontis]|nr:hypothetical protein [Tepidimonas charontis]